MDANKLYNKEYYESHLGDKYERTDVWLGFFGRIADRIVQEIHPNTVLDVGCAKGFLVEALRDRGVDAEGIDISEYAISEVREDIKSYCRVASATDEIKKRYDLIVCIEVFEHINSTDLEKVFKNLCSHTDDILFSSTPFDYNEETHINVKPVENWVEQFYYHGFLHDIEYDVTYISIQAMRFRRQNVSVIQLMREYERVLFLKRQELVPLRNNLNLLQEKIRIAELDNIRYNQEIDTLKTNYEKKLTETSDEIRKLYEEKIENIEKNCQKELERFAEENDNLSKNDEVLRGTIDYLQKEVVSYDKQIQHLIDESLQYQQKCKDMRAESVSYNQQIDHLIEESLFYQQKFRDIDENYRNVVNSYENSTCWKLTKPVRWIRQKFSKNHTR